MVLILEWRIFYQEKSLDVDLLAYAYGMGFFYQTLVDWIVVSSLRNDGACGVGN
jgi:hypothetical protein